MFSKIMKSNCNGGFSDNNLSSEEVAELVQIGTTFVNGLLLGVATEKMVANSVALLFTTITWLRKNVRSNSEEMLRCSQKDSGPEIRVPDRFGHVVHGEKIFLMFWSAIFFVFSQ